jgi:DNA-binding CsgD family transcriptional regulator
MVSIEEYSRLVSGIYTAAVAPRYWEQALHDLHRTMGGISAALCASSGPVWSIEHSNLPEDAARSYAEYYSRLDIVLDAVRAGPVGAVRTGTELITPVRNTEFYVEWMKPNRLEDGLFVRLTPGVRPTCLVVASPRLFGTAERISMLSELVPHLQQAMRIRDKITVLTDELAELTGALETVRHGIMTVSVDRVVLQSNSAAERMLTEGDGLTVRSGRITTCHTRSAAELHAALAAAAVGDGSGVRAGQSFTCIRPSGKRPYVLHVIPAHSSEPSARAAALMLVIDPEDEPDPTAVVLRRLYHLTHAEADVAVRIMRGAGLKQISAILGVSVTTVRTHLQHVFDKTDTHRQAELVHLLHVVDP